MWSNVHNVRTETVGISSRNPSIIACRCWMEADARLFLTNPPPAVTDPVPELADHRVAREMRSAPGHSLAARFPVGELLLDQAQRRLLLVADTSASRHIASCGSHDNPG